MSKLTRETVRNAIKAVKELDKTLDQYHCEYMELIEQRDYWKLYCDEVNETVKRLKVSLKNCKECESETLDHELLVENKNREIEILKEKLDESLTYREKQSHMIAEQGKIVSERDKTIKQMKGTIKRRDSQIETWKATCEFLESRIDEKDKIITNTTQSLDEITKTLSKSPG